MRIVIAFLLTLPLYKATLSDGLSLSVIPVIALQLFAGLDFKIFGSRE